MTPADHGRVVAAAALTALLVGGALLGHDEPRELSAAGASPRSPVAATSPTATPRTSPSARPSATERAGWQGTGSFLVVPGRSGVLGDGPVRRYRVEVERGLAGDLDRYAADFAGFVQRTLGDPRGWGHRGRMSFQRVASGDISFTVVLASPATTDRLCRPLQTNGIFSCYQGGKAVINVMRWSEGARSYAGHLQEYRQYVVSHEVGHALGHGHVSSCRGDGRAPTMMQQTKSLQGCARNPWPYP